MQVLIRPKPRKNCYINVVVDEDVKAEVVNFARQNGVSVAELVRQSVSFFLSENLVRDDENKYEKG